MVKHFKYNENNRVCNKNFFTWYFKLKFLLKRKNKCPECGTKLHKESYHMYYGVSGTHYYCFQCLLSISEQNDFFFRPECKYDIYRYDNIDDLISRITSLSDPIRLKRLHLLNKLLDERQES